MGKWAKYGKKHRKEWEQELIFKGWLTNNDGDNSSYCKLCKEALRPHKKDLERHAGTSKHRRLRATQVDKSQLSMRHFGVSVSNNMVKRKELILASYVATHTSIRSVDHISDIINNFNDKPDQDKLHLHRTKCSAIIKGILGPSLLHELIVDVGNSPFSLIVDESTDVSTEKLLCLNIKYYSSKKNDIVIQFLTFLSVVQTTAEDLFNAVTEFCTDVNLDLKNLIGIATDGASNMCGQHNSLFALLKTKFKLPNLVLVKCICHSLHLCTSKASEIFKDEIDFLLKETYNWFKNSTLRISKYKDIYATINNGNKFYKFTQLSQTRWLARYRAVEKILSQYLELETFFLISCDKEKCHLAKLLSDAYKNKENLLILTFLRPILKQIYYLNLYFQKLNIDYFTAFEDINTLIWSLARQILKPAIVNNLNNNFEFLLNAMKFERNFLPIVDCDLGYEFSSLIDGLNIPQERKIEIQNKCVEFIKVLLEELMKRMPTHLNVFEKIRNFSPQIIINLNRPKFTDLPLNLTSTTKLGDIETQYRNILNINWNTIFDGVVPDDPIVFWKKVATLKNAADEVMFKDLCDFAFAVLSLPSSNAVVERTFSVMNVIKSKLRNRMQLNLLNSIMRVKFNFYVNNICCKDFVPSQDMFSRFNSKMYVDVTKENETEATEGDLDIIEICNFDVEN